MRAKTPPFDLLLITDSQHPQGLLAPVAQALQGARPGRVAIQLRAKTESDRCIEAWAKELRAITRTTGSLLLINGRPDIAIACEADGVHLPEAGISVAAARSLLGKRAWIGISHHDAAGLIGAQTAGADYATLSPLHTVPNKGDPLGTIGFAEAVQQVSMPTFALGGIRSEDIAPMITAGACGVAVCRAILFSSNPCRKLGQWLRDLDNARRIND